MIDADGRQVGVIRIEEAITLANEQGLDLVCVAPSEKVPVCKITDFGKFRYEIMKREREAKKSQRAQVLKEVKISPKIGNHDYQTKLNRSKEFLARGYKIKLNIFFRGREITHVERGKTLMDRLIQDVSELGLPDQKPRLEGKSMIVMLSPKPNDKKPLRKEVPVNETKT